MQHPQSLLRLIIFIKNSYGKKYQKVLTIAEICDATGIPFDRLNDLLHTNQDDEAIIKQLSEVYAGLLKEGGYQTKMEVTTLVSVPQSVFEEGRKKATERRMNKDKQSPSEP